jgi:4-amino-4-deoxy-L-arabinose transferase-like glycosyltransferase
LAHRHRIRIPAPLAALLGAAALLGIVWALLVPPGQAPDENAHVAYVQSLAERGELPEPEGSFQSTEQSAGADAAGADQTAQILQNKPEWSRAAYDRWLERSRELPDEARADGGGPNPAGPNPPLYYVWELVPYELASGGDIFARITAMRLASIPFLLVTVVATWLLAGIVFRRNRALQLAAASVPALLPMMTFVSASVSPDPLVYALWSLALWLGARVIVERAGLVELAALFAVAGLAVVAKSTSYALLPGVVFVLAVAVWRMRAAPRRVVVALACVAIAFAATAGTWYVIARASDRSAAAQLTEAERPPDFDEKEFVGYVWQYYLPRLPFMEPYPNLDWPPQAYQTWFKHAWGAFGWLETRYPRHFYWLLGLVTIAVAAGALVALIRRRNRLNIPLLVFFALVVVVLVGGLHWNEYRLAESRGILLNQGRYLFPAIALAGLAVGAALSALPGRVRAPALGVWLGGLGALQMYAIGVVAVRFYA